MGVSVGTIVTRYDSGFRYIPCFADELACVGHVTTIVPDLDNPGDPAVLVEWWNICSYHRESDDVHTGTNWCTLDQLWQIGQIPQM